MQSEHEALAPNADGSQHWPVWELNCLLAEMTVQYWHKNGSTMQVAAAQLSPAHVKPLLFGLVCKLKVKFWKLHQGRCVKDVRERE
jgi:hypothetical protein